MQTGVYGDAVHMLELDLFLEKRERKHIKAFIFLFPSEKHTSDSWKFQVQGLLEGEACCWTQRDGEAI